MKTRAELTFPAELKNEAILCSLCKKFDIIVNIIEASFSTDTGWAILVLDGSDGEVKLAIDYLKDKGIKIDSIL